MRYADFYECDICNGNHVGMTLFVQGCPFHCKGCFNQETWDFNGGKEWTEETEKRFLELVSRDYIKRVSFLGGEPLANENVETVYELIRKIRKEYPDKEIWIYSGYKFEDIVMSYDETRRKTQLRSAAVFNADVLVDGQFEYDKRNLTLAFCGSSNQRVIDVKKTALKWGEEEKIYLWTKDA